MLGLQFLGRELTSVLGFNDMDPAISGLSDCIRCVEKEAALVEHAGHLQNDLLHSQTLRQPRLIQAAEHAALDARFPGQRTEPSRVEEPALAKAGPGDQPACGADVRLTETLGQ